MTITSRVMTLGRWIVFALVSVALAPYCLHAQTAKSWATVASERSHMIAGVALIAIALLVMAGSSSQKLRPLLSLWPLVFLAMGLYLLAWSDPEIWPRGPFSWLWMIEHNPEARQHKLYGLLLLALGAIEFLGARGKLTPRWRTWSFPVLAVFGALLLTMHSHSSGLPKGWNPSQGATLPAQANPPLVAVLEPLPKPQDSARQESDHAGNGHHHHGEESLVASAAEATPAGNHHDHHLMNPKMQRIQRQHVWMAILGIAVAMFKFLADGGFLRNRIVAYLWPSAVAALGLLLIFYRE